MWRGNREGRKKEFDYKLRKEKERVMKVWFLIGIKKGVHTPAFRVKRIGKKILWY